MESIIKQIPNTTMYADNKGNIYDKNMNPKNILKNRDEYYRVSCKYKNKNQPMRVHCLVYMAFNGEYDTKQYVIDHKNRRKWDNRIANLRAVSKRENAKNHKHINISKYKRVIDTNTGKIYNSQTECIKQLFNKPVNATTTSRICKHLKGITNSVYGYKLKYHI